MNLGILVGYSGKIVQLPIDRVKAQDAPAIAARDDSHPARVA